MVRSAFVEGLLLAQQVERKVPEPTRTFILMALLGIALLGLLLVAIAMLGASWARKQGFRRKSVVPADKFIHEQVSNPSRTGRQGDHFNSAETFTGDDTLSNDDTVVS
jgi:hypothetical protein